ncbi:MAG: putative nucleotidyltransferase [Paraglaciecola sp.]|jgi:predicted nucleotidyltransferase
MAKISQEQLINDIRALILAQCENIKLIYLFGSHAQGLVNS